jgi:hypothetical protein
MSLQCLLDFLILSPEQYWVRNTDHSAPHYAASSTPLLPRPCWTQLDDKPAYPNVNVRYPCRGLSVFGLLHSVPINEFVITHVLSEFLHCIPYGWHILTSCCGMVGVGRYHFTLRLRLASGMRNWGSDTGDVENCLLPRHEVACLVSVPSNIASYTRRLECSMCKVMLPWRHQWLSHTFEDKKWAALFIAKPTTVFYQR